ncbi:MAG: flagellar basal body rod protein FlgB [Cycloclasticus sp.]|jgi:flagellar basal body rod protein FlgB
MTGLKDQYLEEQEDHYTQLADALGITWEELITLEYEVSANMSKDGLIYEYVVTFSEESDKQVLGNVSGLDSNLTVHLPPWALERSADDEYELGAIFDNTEYKMNFLCEIENLDRLREIDTIDPDLRKILLRQLFISIIGAVETYLSDAFINKALSSETYLENFVTTHPEFKKQKISVSDVFSVSKNIKEKAKTIMVATIYHKLPLVKEMYQKTFDIKFPDISKMQQYVIQRHDLVHRNGKTTNGETVNVDEETIESLKNSAKQLIYGVSDAFEYDDIPF